MNLENAIEVRDVHKYFKVYLDKGHMLRERVIHFSRNKYERREVLKGISFDVKKGESVGLIGKNGCGKSTTLKMLTKILRPNSGTIETQGRICSLIELGAGFHPDMSGRENIYINASIFGIKAREVDRRLNDIIRFSELEDYIDNPVRTYSSGMYMRLAFSVAINVDADILLIDEILAVGDNAFQTKCFNKLKSLKDQGTTIVIVSHALGQVEKLCDKAVWIEKGLIRKIGPARQVCSEYLDVMEQERIARAEMEYRMLMEESEKADASDQEQQERLRARRKSGSCRDLSVQCGPDARREGSGEVRFTGINVYNSHGEKTLDFNINDPFILELFYESDLDDALGNFSINFTRSDWVYCYGTTSKLQTGEFIPLQKTGKVRFEIDALRLLADKYYIDLRIHGTGKDVYDCIFSMFEIRISNPDEPPKESGIVMMDCSWTVEE